MIGFPGAVGGEVYMNASANGQAISDNFLKARCYSRERGVFELTKEEMHWIPVESLGEHRVFPVFLKEYLSLSHSGIEHIVSDDRKF